MITEEYKKQLEELQSKKRFQSSLVKYDVIKNFIERYKPNSLLDYGCAQGELIKQIKIDFPSIETIDGYDPGVPKYSRILKSSYDCVISNDVIEHFEPHLLDKTLKSINSLFERYAWFIIACYPAKKSLPDGRNAHLIIENPDWWMNKVNNIFSNCTIIYNEVIYFKPGKPELRIILKK